MIITDVDKNYSSIDYICYRTWNRLIIISAMHLYASLEWHEGHALSGSGGPQRLVVEGRGARCYGGAAAWGDSEVRGRRRVSRPLPVAGLVLRFAPIRFAPVSIKCAYSLLNIYVFG